MEFYDPELVLETEHLILRKLERTDALAIYHMINHDRDVLKYYVAPYMANENEASVEGTVTYSEKAGVYAFAVILKESGEVIGMLNQCNRANRYFNNIEVGYALGKEYWNKGYCTEALKAFIRMLFERGVHKVYCGHILENKASERVMIKAGMIREGIRKEELYYRDRYWDVNYYYLINEGSQNEL